MNVIGLKKNDIVLDPMMGSGTTNIEASLIGLKSIGIDANPFCKLIAQTKVDALDIDFEEIFEYTKKSNEDL